MENVATEEFISRTEALKDFEANNARNPYWTPPRVKTLLLRQPTADVAEVVRCRDCKYGDYDSKPDGAIVCLRTNDGFWRKETDFCSYGEYQTNTGGVTE